MARARLYDDGCFRLYGIVVYDSRFRWYLDCLPDGTIYNSLGVAPKKYGCVRYRGNPSRYHLDYINSYARHYAQGLANGRYTAEKGLSLTRPMIDTKAGWKGK
jgi:hypothetical protein